MIPMQTQETKKLNKGTKVTLRDFKSCDVNASPERQAATYKASSKIFNLALCHCSRARR